MKIGIEVHFQLDTENKLFCKCRTGMDEKVRYKIFRKMYPVAGELGDVDPAVLYEFMRDKKFEYEQFDETTCLICGDEEPPLKPNSEAVKIALQVAKMLNCFIPEELHFMRKTIIDGSAVSGFQRTCLVGLNGFINTSFGKVGITNVQLEEDAAAIVKKKGKKTIYRLDRLGVPLIEIATTPNCRSPEQARELAEKLGMILASTGKLKSRLGAIRQDVNISIPKGERVEIKGVQSLSAIEKAIQNEVDRQTLLIQRGDKVKQETRRLKEDFSTEFMRPMPGKARLYPETDVRPVLTKKILETLEIPKTLEEKIMKLSKKYKISELIASRIIMSPYYDIFVKYGRYDPIFIGAVLTSYTNEAKKLGEITPLQVEQIIKLYTKKTISKDGVYDVVMYVAKKGVSVDSAIKKVVGKKDLDSVIDKVIKQKSKFIKERKEDSIKPLMGLVMKEVRGSVSGKVIFEKLKKKIKELI